MKTETNNVKGSAIKQRCLNQFLAQKFGGPCRWLCLERLEITLEDLYLRNRLFNLKNKISVDVIVTMWDSLGRTKRL